ncbi:MAG: DUF4242 domain-containing protein [Gammaproteobacteria bacterium]
MTMLVLERSFEPPLSPQSVIDIARRSAWCFEQYRVEWLGSLLAIDGRSMVCRFEAPDAESTRQALITIEADIGRLWEGTTHAVEDPEEPNVIVERSFEAPVALADVQALEDASQWCLDARNVRFVKTFFSTDRKRMLCLYRAPDAESVRAAQHQAQMPLDRVWSFEEVLLR